jgi:trans-aconitate methyltransferase
MRTSLLLLLLVAVRAVVGASNRSWLPDDTELVATCVPRILDGVLLSAHMPDWMLKLKQVAKEAPWGLEGGAPDEESLRRKLKEHPQITAIAVSLSRPPGHAAVVYRTSDESVLVHQLTNLSSLVDTTWRSVLDTSWNQSYKASNNSEGWTPPFLDCLTAKWLFGYSVSFHRYSTTGKYSKSSDSAG